MTDREELAKLFPPMKRKPMTNADRIRSMSDEELADWLADHPLVSEYDENNPQHKAWLDWLKQASEAEVV